MPHWARHNEIESKTRKMTAMIHFTDEDLFQLDREFAELDIPIHARPFRAAARILGGSFSIGPFYAGDDVNQICEAYRKLFPGCDFWPGAGKGLVASVDRVRTFTLPVVLGEYQIQVDSGLGFETPAEWSVWCRNDSEIGLRSAYAFADVYDLSTGADMLARGTDSYDYLQRARQHLADVAASLSLSGAASEAALQHIILICELSLKAVLLHLGVTTKDLKDNFGHNIPKLARELSRLSPHSDDEVMIRACEAMPNLVASRYSTIGMTRLKIIQLALAGQFVAAAAVRRLGFEDLANQMGRTELRPPLEI